MNRAVKTFGERKSYTKIWYVQPLAFILLSCLYPACNIKEENRILADSIRNVRSLTDNVMLEFSIYSDSTQNDVHRICNKDSVYFIFHDGFDGDTITFERVAVYYNKVYSSRSFTAMKGIIWNFSISGAEKGFFRISINGKHKFTGRIKGDIFNSVRFDLTRFLKKDVKNDSPLSTVFSEERTLIVTYSNCAYPIGKVPTYIHVKEQ